MHNFSKWNWQAILRIGFLISSSVEDSFKPRTWWCKSLPFFSWEYWKTHWTNNSFCSCVKTVHLRVRTSRILVSGWVLGGDSGFSSALVLCLVNIIFNLWYSQYDPLRDIVLCYLPWLFPVSEMSSHCQCRCLMLDPLRCFDVVNHTGWTWTKGLYILRKFSGYLFYTSTFFNGVYTKQGKVE